MLAFDWSIDSVFFANFLILHRFRHHRGIQQKNYPLCRGICLKITLAYYYAGNIHSEVLTFTSK